MAEADLVRIGDCMQSESSRLAAWVRDNNVQLPYEAFMALCQVETSVQQWTAARAAMSRERN